MSEYDADLLTSDVNFSDFFESVINELQQNLDNKDYIKYTTDTITFLGNSPGNVTQFPPHGSQLSIQRWKTVYGFRTEIEGGVTLVTYLTARGWTVRTE